MIKLAIIEIIIIALLLTIYYVLYYLIKKYLEKLKEKADFNLFEYENYDKDFHKHSMWLKNNLNIVKLEKEKFSIKTAIDNYERKYNEHAISLNFQASYLAIIIATIAVVISMPATDEKLGPVIIETSTLITSETPTLVTTDTSMLETSDSTPSIREGLVVVIVIVIFLQWLWSVHMLVFWVRRNKSLLKNKEEILSQKLKLMLIDKEIEQLKEMN